jgi:hypothetical protein
MTWRELLSVGFDEGEPEAARWGAWGGIDGSTVHVEDGTGGIPGEGLFLVALAHPTGGGLTRSAREKLPPATAAGPARVHLTAYVSTAGASASIALECSRADGSDAGLAAPPVTEGRVQGGAGWQTVAATIQLPAGTATFRPVVTVDAPAADAWVGVTDVRVEVWEPATLTATTGLNLLGNGGFRSRDGLVRRPSSWIYDGNGLTLELSRVCAATEAELVLHDGDYMAADEALGGSTLVMKGAGGTDAHNWPKFHQTVPVLEARRYMVRALMAGSDGGEAYIFATPLGADATTPTGPDWYFRRPITGYPGGPELEGWAEVIGAMVTPPGTRFLRVAVMVTTAAGQPFLELFDEVGLYEEAVPDRWDIEDDAYRSSLPYPAVYLGPGTIDKPTRRYEHLVRSASWQLGRSWWFGSPEVGTCSVELEGDRHELVPGDVCSIARDPLGLLWTGRVDDVTVEEHVEAGEVVVTTRVSAVDATGWLAGTKLAGWAATAQPVDQRIVALYSKAGAIVTTRTMPSAVALPSSLGGTIGTAAAPVTALDRLDQDEREANAISQIGPDGVVRVLTRAALPADLAGVATPVPLVGDDAPVTLQLDRAAVGKVVNLWRFADGEELYTTAIPEGGTSASRYGTREYDCKGTKATASARYTAPMREVVARALPAFLVSVKVHRRAQPFAGLGPFDLVETRGEKLQALQLAHKVDPGSWVVTASLDATQTAIVGGPVDTTPPAPVRKRATVTLTANKDGYAVRTNSGSNSGNGASGNILVGLLGDGHLCRGFVAWASQTFLGRNRKVVSATLTLTTNRGGCMQWSTAPKITVKRVTATWSEGTHATACSFITGNALKYPGPGVTSTGQVTASIPAADSRAVNIRIDAIAQAWLDGSAQHGVGLFGASESSSANRAAFDASGSGRAKLVLVYEYDE